MDVNTFLAFDQSLLLFLNGSNSIFMDNLIIVLTSGWTWIPLYLSLLYVVVKNNETMGQILLIIGCAAFCILLSGGVSDFIVKPFFARERPDILRLVTENSYSFPSGHAMVNMALYTVLIIYAYKFIRSKRIKYPLIILMMILVIAIGFTRIYLGVHYAGDIIGGWLLGFAIGLCVYMLMKNSSINDD